MVTENPADRVVVLFKCDHCELCAVRDESAPDVTDYTKPYVFPCLGCGCPMEVVETVTYPDGERPDPATIERFAEAIARAEDARQRQRGT